MYLYICTHMYTKLDVWAAVRDLEVGSETLLSANRAPDNGGGIGGVSRNRIHCHFVRISRFFLATAKVQTLCSTAGRKY